MILRNGSTIHLQGKNISYVMFQTEEKELLHFYFGKKIADSDYSNMEEEWKEQYGFPSNEFPLDVYPQEYPAFGWSDLRNPAYQVLNSSGNAVSHLLVKDTIIHESMTMDIDGMPSLFQGDQHADTLEVVLVDENIGLQVQLFYTVYDEYDIIARYNVITNVSDSDKRLLSAYSTSLDLPIGDYDMIYFPGTWAKEREMVRTPLTMGIKAEAENSRGMSSHQMNPFVMIASPNADEQYGEVYAFSLIYSGNHSTVANVDQYGNLRVQQGINPYQFQWDLKSGESFVTPQSVMCYSNQGFAQMSLEYQHLYHNNLMRSKWKDRVRPILINNWEGTYFKFTEEKLLDMAKLAKETGIELFVLDDGWFGKRDNDACSLGDWVVHKEKMPSGIDGFAKKINDLGMKFGLWFEPEMVSPDSDLYRAHPDWAVQVPERTPVESRHQLILDLSRDDVCDYIIKAVCDILASANIEYVKWDMNRQMTDMPCLGYNHKYTLGFYRIMSAITEAFPDVLFEGCCSGGGRFDAGVLAYMPQIWTSDNSDALSRMQIQYSTSMCYPSYSMAAHVTASPNHQLGRITTLKTRADVAYIGDFGYELDITKCSEEELEEIKEQIVFQKKIRHLMCEGDFYRLSNPYETNFCGWQVVSKDKKKVFVFTSKILSYANGKSPYVKLAGLDENQQYRNLRTGIVYSGALLMYKGVKANYAKQDFATEVMEFEMA
ncbi:MAG: alpha-galactosidase [Lachnospiraceae bacterium]